jgi:hypothetical protein
MLIRWIDNGSITVDSSRFIPQDNNMNHHVTDRTWKWIHLAQDSVQKGCLREDSSKPAGFVKSDKILYKFSNYNYSRGSLLLWFSWFDMLV